MFDNEGIDVLELVQRFDGVLPKHVRQCRVGEQHNPIPVNHYTLKRTSNQITESRFTRPQRVLRLNSIGYVRYKTCRALGAAAVAEYRKSRDQQRVHGVVGITDQSIFFVHDHRTVFQHCLVMVAAGLGKHSTDDFVGKLAANLLVGKPNPASEIPIHQNIAALEILQKDFEWGAIKNCLELTVAEVEVLLSGKLTNEDSVSKWPLVEVRANHAAVETHRAASESELRAVSASTFASPGEWTSYRDILAAFWSGESFWATDGWEKAIDGATGQSLGAFLAPGVDIVLNGVANDSVGKGMSGGRIIIRSRNAAVRAQADVRIGNAALYGATGGSLFVQGTAGERFAVRNSGATAVTEGIGDHGCEYMTAGTVLVLGPTGRNFAAGMSGGSAYVFDADGKFTQRCNPGMVDIRPLNNDDETIVKDLIREHYRLTESQQSWELSTHWPRYQHRFLKISPKATQHQLGRAGQTNDQPALRTVQQ